MNNQRSKKKPRARETARSLNSKSEPGRDSEEKDTQEHLAEEYRADDDTGPVLYCASPGRIPKP
jgi:hypothetical protein